MGMMVGEVGAINNPQYVILNKTPTGGDASQTCCFWYPQNATTLTDQAIDEIVNKLQTKGTENRKLAVGYIVEYLEKNTDSENVIRKLTEISDRKGIPIMIKLSAHFWNTRPELWKWWEAGISQSEIERRKNNVEWTSFNGEATKASWFNWGVVMKAAPPKNLGSPEVIRTKQESMRPLLKIINDWYSKLPSDQKYRLAGVVLDGELSVGINDYFYPNGNDYPFELGKGTLPGEPNYVLDFNKGISGGVAQIGYAAVKSYGIKNGGVITKDDLISVVKKHAEMLGRLGYESGLPTNKIYIHGLGDETNIGGGLPTSYSSIFNGWVRPGWSFYGRAFNPASEPKLASALNEINNTSWGAVEWMYMGGNMGEGVDQWTQAMKNTLNFRNSQMVSLYNWESIANNNDTIMALKNVLNEQICWADDPVAKAEKQLDGKWKLSWEGGEGESFYLNASTTNDRNVDGSLKNINVINEAMGNGRMTIKSLPSGDVYWQVVGDKVCNGSTYRRMSEVIAIDNILSGDTNGDGKVDLIDFSTWKDEYIAKTKSKADFNNDGVVDLIDFSMWKDGYLKK